MTADGIIRKTTVTMGLALIIGFLAVGCGPQKAVSSTMSDAQQQALKTSLAELEDTLRDKAPFISAQLASAATDAELATLRAELGGVQVQCLELWYQWHNGCIQDFLPLGRMLSISEALENKRLEQSISAISANPFIDAKRKSALKILDDGAGDGYFLDITSPEPRVFQNFLESPGSVDYGTMQEFVTFMIQVHAAGLASENERENGPAVFDWDRYQEIEAEYLKRIKRF